MRVWQAKVCTSTTVQPELDTVHAKLFAGVVSRDQETGTIWTAAKLPPLRVVKNLYGLGDLFPADYQFCISEKLLPPLRAVCSAVFRPVEISLAYYYPFAPGDMGFERDDAFKSNESSDGIAMRFAQKYRVPSPDLKYYEVVAPCVADVQSEYCDWKDFRLGDLSRGVVNHGAVISRTMIEHHGMCISAGYQMSDVVYAILRENFAWPFFWTTSINI